MNKPLTVVHWKGMLQTGLILDVGYVPHTWFSVWLQAMQDAENSSNTLYVFSIPNGNDGGAKQMQAVQEIEKMLQDKFPGK